MTREQSALWSRTYHRRLHLVFASILGIYIYSPLGGVQAVELIVQTLVFPALALSGILLWRGRQIQRWLTTRITAGGSS